MTDSEQIKLRSFLKEHGIKLQYVAHRIGITPSLLRYYLDGTTLPEQMEQEIRAKLCEHSRAVKAICRGSKRRFE